MAAIKLEAFIIAQPVKHRVAFFNFQRCPEDRFIRHFGVMHLNGQSAILNVLNWLRNDKGFQLDGRHIDVKAKAVHARGDFRYLKPEGEEPWLGILAGISTDDGSQALRYFPENLMGKALVDYLSGPELRRSDSRPALYPSGFPGNSARPASHHRY